MLLGTLVLQVNCIHTKIRFIYQQPDVFSIALSKFFYTHFKDFSLRI